MLIKQQFFDWLATYADFAPTVVELGVKEWGAEPPHHNRAKVLECCPTAKWTGVDIKAGIDVDIVADAQRLSEHFKKRSVEAVLSSWTFEHIARPWLAAQEIVKILKIGGHVLVETHQTFPLHDYPSDYFRFSIPALKELFSEDLGMHCVHAEYLAPSKICPLVNDVDDYDICRRWNFQAESYLVVVAHFEKVN